MTTDGEQLKFDGMDLALSRDGLEPWKDRFESWVLAQPSGSRFTSETVTAHVGLPSGEVGTNQNNAVGAMVSALANDRVIRKVGHTQSRNRWAHAATLIVWERR